MARLWTGGAEKEDAGGGDIATSAANVAIVTSPVRSGNFSWQFKATTDGTGIIRPDLFSVDQNSILFVRAYFYFTALPIDNNIPIIRVLNVANASQGRVLWSTNGTLRVQTASNVVVGATVPFSSVPLNKWHCIEFMLDATTNPGTLQMRLNGTVMITGTNSSQGSWARVQLGATTNPAIYEFYMDDVAINDSTGTEQNSYPGNGKVIILRPNGLGDANGWVIAGTGSPSANSWENVIESPADDSATLLASGSIIGTESLFNIQDCGLDVYDFINVVHVGCRFRNGSVDAITSFRVEAIKQSGGTKAQSPDIIPNSSVWRSNQPNVNVIYPLTLYKDPDGNVWKKSALDTMQIGMILTAFGSSGIQITNLWAIVEYVPYSYGGAQLLQLLL